MTERDKRSAVRTDDAKRITGAVLAAIKTGGDNLAIYQAVLGALPAAQDAGMCGALTECIDTLALVEHPARVDPQYGEEVRQLGERIGYGALMTSASASWRQSLSEKGWPVGGEFVAGPCFATVVAALKKAREAISVPSASRGTEA